MKDGPSLGSPSSSCSSPCPGVWGIWLWTPGSCEQPPPGEGTQPQGTAALPVPDRQAGQEEKGTLALCSRYIGNCDATLSPSCPSLLWRKSRGSSLGTGSPACEPGLQHSCRAGLCSRDSQSQICRAHGVGWSGMTWLGPGLHEGLGCHEWVFRSCTLPRRCDVRCLFGSVKQQRNSGHR